MARRSSQLDVDRRRHQRRRELIAQHGLTRGSRLRQVFEYREQTSSFAPFFTKGGLRLHNPVVHEQVEQAAAAADGQSVTSDIPPEYRRW